MTETRSTSRLRLALNLGSSYANVALMAVVTVLVVPVYVHALGASQWGAVALCMTLQGLLFSIDSALAPLMLRDVARATLSDRHYASYIGFLRLYGGIALGVFAIAQIAVLVWSRRSDVDTSALLAWPLRLVLVQFLFQFANNAALGYWNGMQLQRMANLRQAAFMLIKHALALLLVLHWQATAIGYLLPFALLSMVEFGVNLMRIRGDAAAARDIDQSSIASGTAAQRADATIDWPGLRSFAWVAVIGIFGSQIDRGWLSLTLPATQYGIYFLVASLMLSLFSLQVPIHRAFLPAMAIADRPWRVMVAMMKVSVVVLSLPCVVMAVLAEPLLQLWLHDAAITRHAAGTLRLMLFAVALLSVYAPLGTLLMSQQRYRALIITTSCALLVQTMVLALLTPRIGMIAGGWAWIGSAVVQLIAGATLFARVGQRDGRGAAAR